MLLSLRALIVATGCALLLSVPSGAQEPAPKDTTPKADTTRKTRRIALTSEMERTAFKDAQARVLLTRARVARVAQDSALRTYDATSYMRVSVGMGIRRLGPERLLFRAEHAARVRWGRESGAWVETTGRRAVVPMGNADMDMTPATPIPYFPGREQLWFPSEELRKVREEVNDRDLIHPLATGAEAYYRYETGDSVSIRLPDGRSIQLRELEITARRPEWRAFVGSFWFDVSSGLLVRAAYRMAAEMDIWREVSEETKKEIAEIEATLATDTGEVARKAREKLKDLDDDDPPALVKGIFSPMRAKVSAITVEYGLYEGRFWLPKRNVLEGEAVAMFMRVPVRYEESYRYHSVNGDVPVPKVPTVGEMGLTAEDTSYMAEGNVVIGNERRAAQDTSLAARTAREDSTVRYRHNRSDSLLRIADSLKRADGDTARISSLERRARNNRVIARQIIRRREECARDSSYFGGITSVYGAVRMAIRLPCDTAKLSRSADLPASIYDANDQMFSTADRDQLLEGLDFGLQPGWGPQPPTLHMGLDLLRYNRIEGLSVGASATSVLGLGYTAQGVVRFGTGDLVPNGELTLSRSNGRSDIRLTGFHRFSVANDDWGAPLSFGASVVNLLFAQDEGFYYRSWGAELGGTRDAPGPMSGARMRWRVFGERHYSADTAANTQFSVSKYLGNARFRENIDAEQLVALGAGAELVRSFGVNPRSFRLDARARGEGALTDQEELFGTSGYARLVLDGTLSGPLGAFGFSLTGAGGSSLGSLPIQRAFFVGGLHTVRGQNARLEGEGRVGDTFWLGRGEIARSGMAARLALFYDIGWAGARDELSNMGRPLSGAGVGLSIMDGFLRFDLSRGIYPEQKWRGDFYIGSRF